MNVRGLSLGLLCHTDTTLCQGLFVLSHEARAIRPAPDTWYGARAAQRPSNSSQYWLWDQLSASHLVASFILSDTGVLLLRACEVSFFVLTLALEGSTGACCLVAPAAMHTKDCRALLLTLHSI